MCTFFYCCSLNFYNLLKPSVHIINIDKELTRGLKILLSNFCNKAILIWVGQEVFIELWPDLPPHRRHSRVYCINFWGEINFYHTGYLNTFTLLKHREQNYIDFKYFVNCLNNTEKSFAAHFHDFGRHKITLIFLTDPTKIKFQTLNFQIFL